MGTKSGTVCWMIPDGNPSSTATEAMDYCKTQRSHMCTHNEMIEACDNGSGNTIYGDSSGWYGDHGVSSTSGTWDDYFGTWNSASCPTTGNNDGPPYTRTSSFKFRCCARAYPTPSETGWTKILQYGTAYTPTTSAVGNLDTDAASSFAKLSDAAINSIETDANGYYYYKLHDSDDTDQPDMYVRTTSQFSDTSRAFGWSNNFAVCQSLTSGADPS